MGKLNSLHGTWLVIAVSETVQIDFNMQPNFKLRMDVAPQM